jgi:hypothetical protein
VKRLWCGLVIAGSIMTAELNYWLLVTARVVEGGFHYSWIAGLLDWYGEPMFVISVNVTKSYKEILRISTGIQDIFSPRLPGETCF